MTNVLKVLNHKVGTFSFIHGGRTHTLSRRELVIGNAPTKEYFKNETSKPPNDNEAYHILKSLLSEHVTS